MQCSRHQNNIIILLIALSYFCSRQLMTANRMDTKVVPSDRYERRTRSVVHLQRRYAWPSSDLHAFRIQAWTIWAEICLCLCQNIRTVYYIFGLVSENCRPTHLNVYIIKNSQNSDFCSSFLPPIYMQLRRHLYRNNILFFLAVCCQVT